MARGGINQALVEQAYQALLARGERPTIDAIRRELGDTGSKTTISRYLNDIKEAQGVRLDDEALLSDNLKAMVGRLARQLHTEAQAIVEASEEQQQTALTSLQQQLAEQQQALALTQETLLQTQAELTVERQAHQATQQTLNEQSAQRRETAQALADAQQRLTDKDRQIESLEEKHRHARESLEHYRASVKDQREQEQRRHEHQVQQLQTEQRQQAQTLAVKQNELTLLHKDNARLSAELKDSQRENRALQQDLQITRTALQTLQGEQIQQMSAYEQLAAQREALQVAQTELQGHYETVQQTLKAQETQRLQLEARLAAQADLYQELKQQLAALRPPDPPQEHPP